MNQLKQLYSKELDEVALYMETTVLLELPSKELLPEHFMIAILDTKSYHAHMLLENSLKESNIENLREVIAEALRTSNNEINGINKSIKDTPFSKEMSTMLDNADAEKEATGYNILGTEHFLLAILNPKFNFKCGKILNSAGIDYQSIFDKCKSNNKKKKDAE